MDLFKTLNAIYTKQKLAINTVEKKEVIGLFRWLAMDLDNLPILKRINQYLFYLSPENLLILLYFSIPQRYKAPYMKYTKKVEKPEIGVLYAKIQGYFGWSQRELELNEKYLNRLDIKFWNKVFGVHK